MAIEKTSRSLILVVALVALAVFGLGPASSQQEGATVKTQWEYHTGNIDPSTLQATLNQLGSDGWDVFSLVRLDSKLVEENGGNFIKTTGIQLTAKRIAVNKK